MTRVTRQDVAAASAALAQHLQSLRRAEPVSKAKPVKCDCLNWCGDDPWLEDGRAKKCATYAALHPPKCSHCGGTGYEP